MKNEIKVTGIVCKEAKRFNVFGYEEKEPLVSFVLKSYPDESSGEPLKIQVHLMDFNKSGIEKKLLKNQEVSVEGELVQKSYVTSNGDFRVKFYVKAKNVCLKEVPGAAA